MRQELEADYLVVGAGASGMAFTDTLLAESDADVVLVDRRHQPGGHWLDAYPFVRLHQPSAYYGVNSMTLGNDRIDDSGANAGSYERASAAEISDYYARVLNDGFLPTGRVKFLGMSEYRRGDPAAHRIVSLLDGAETVVRARRRVVDATYVESQIPSRHVPGFAVDEGVRLIPPNDLVDLAEPADRFTVIGAGKTAMDTCNWLLDTCVDPERIRWIRSRDPWLLDRSFVQPLELVGSYMQLQARWVEAAAVAEDGPDFAHRLEEAGVFVRIDPSVEPLAFRGATISQIELESLRTIDHVVRVGRVRHVSRTSITTDGGDIPGGPREVYVDCTAAGVRPTRRQRIFEPERLTIQYVTVGLVPWSSATIACVESTGIEDDEKNRLCPPVVFSGNVSDLLQLARPGLHGRVARDANEEVAAWNHASRLNPARAAADHVDDRGVAEARAAIRTHLQAALQNLEERTTALSGSLSSGIPHASTGESARREPSNS